MNKTELRGDWTPEALRVRASLPKHIRRDLSHITIGSWPGGHSVRATTVDRTTYLIDAAGNATLECPSPRDRPLPPETEGGTP